MDKAIKALEFERSIYATDGGNHIEKIKELDEAIAELRAYKAKVDELKEVCNKEIARYNKMIQDRGFVLGASGE